MVYLSLEGQIGRIGTKGSSGRTKGNRDGGYNEILDTGPASDLGHL